MLEIVTWPLVRMLVFPDTTRALKIHSDSRLENDDVPIVRSAGQVSAAGVEHPANVRVKMPVELAHRQSHSPAVDIAIVQIRVGEAAGNFECAPSSTAPIKIPARDHTLELPADAVIRPAFASQKPACARVKAVEVQAFIRVFEHQGINEFSLQS